MQCRVLFFYLYMFLRARILVPGIGEITSCSLIHSLRPEGDWEWQVLITFLRPESCIAKGFGTLFRICQIPLLHLLSFYFPACSSVKHDVLRE